MKKILCPGEALIDLFGVESKPLIDTTKFEKKAGGAPANAAGAMAKFGVKSYFAGSVGNDPYGHFLKREMDKYHIDTTYLQLLDQHFTSFAHVSIDETGERDFIFNRGADAQFSLQDIDLEKFDGFHFASATAFLGNKLNDSYDQILEYASNHNKFISFDANFRDALFGLKTEVFVRKCKEYIEKANIIKLSEEELLLISGIKDVTKAGISLSKTTVGYIVVTLGCEGSILFYDGESYPVPTINVEKVIDTTGAGDAFIGCLVAQAINSEKLSCETLIPLIKTANKVGALTTTKIGALESIPNSNCI